MARNIHLILGSISLMILLSVSFLHCSEDAHGHEHGHAGALSESNVIEEFKETLNISDTSNFTSINKAGLQVLMDKAGFRDCSLIPSTCSLCVPLDVVLTRLAYSTSPTASYDNEKLLGVLSSILYLLGNQSGAVCNTPLASFPLAQNVTAFRGVKQQHGGQTSSTFTEATLDSVLEAVNKTIGHLLTNTECYDVDDVFKGTNVSESDVDEHKFEIISAFVVLKVLKGNCISEHSHGTTSTLPSKSTFINTLFSEYGSNGTMSLAKFERLLKAVGVGNEPANDTSGGGHDGHDHKRKRRSLLPWDVEIPVETEREHSVRSRRSTADTSGAIATTCYTPESLLKIYNVSESQGLSQSQFTELCPSIVQQIESGACKTTATATSKTTEDGWKPWASALISVLVISLGSLAGIIAVPINSKPIFSRILTFFIALAASTLLGDGLLHLLPHSYNLHKHEESASSGSHASHDVFETDSFIWKSLLVIAGIYTFYLFEIMMHLCGSGHSHSHGLDDSHQHVARVPSHRRKISGPVELVAHNSNKRKSLVHTPGGLHACGSEPELNGHKESEQGYEQQGGDVELRGWNKFVHAFKRYESVVYMVLIGDAVHNFMDGVVIGIAYTEKFPTGFSGGLSTSIAVMCHEIPHELGDFAVLVASGMSMSMALFLNFVSSLTAFIGAIVGVAIGQEFNALPWMFAITAGLFIYIALTDLIPELLHSTELHKSPGSTVLLQSSGLLVGFTIMFILAAYEEDIKVSV